MKVALLILMFVPIMSMANPSKELAKSSDELCDFIEEQYGFNEMTLFCAAVYGADVFTSSEASFCHQAIQAEILTIPECFEIIVSNETIEDGTFDYCREYADKSDLSNCIGR